MIAFLRGKIINKGLNSIILEVNNIGYQLFISESFSNDLELGQNLEVYTYHRVREEASDLYGFKTLEDLELFTALLSVSGVGPKSALGVLNIASANDIKETIILGDAQLLTKVSGIGKKTAARLVLELRNKLRVSQKSNQNSNHLSSSSGDEIDALLSLGYSLSDARAALNLVDSQIKDSGERVRAALKKMLKK